MAGAGKIRVKFLVDNEKRKVVFAESGKEFVDVLLSFLTLPLGTPLFGSSARSHP
jgi:hypothetical protein